MHIAKIAGADTTWYHADALGSVRKMTKEDGTGYDWAATYYPFGEMTQTGAGSNTHGFTGKEFDSEMNLNYFCLRYYDPQIGRFMTLDPFGGYVELPQSQNRYAYVMNNPLKYIDPLGLQGDPTEPWPEGPGMYVWWKGAFLQIGYGVEARATLSDFQRLGLMTSGLLGLGGINPEDISIPQLKTSIEDIIRQNLGMFPGFRLTESGGVERIRPETNLNDRPVAMPSAPSYSSTAGRYNVPAIGIQFQVQATFLLWGVAAGSMFIDKQSLIFTEKNQGIGFGVNIGLIVANNKGPFTGLTAEMTGGVGWPIPWVIGPVVTGYTNGITDMLFIGIGIGTITWSSGLVETAPDEKIGP